ncbi:hypothetical protein [Amycolatopsis sp. NPDC059657]|uniref:hypothetical protein n=1 Tax=Amycolatopsis sp. NPDC059657 TaxID=3346899 RepID=UPI00366ECA3A
MRIKPACDLAIHFDGRGRLEILSLASGGYFTYEGRPVALWLALMQGTTLDGSAELLAEFWDDDIADIALEMALWAHDWCSDGLLRVEHEAAR